MSANNPDALCREVFDLAKGYYYKSIFCKLAVYITGVASLFITDAYSLAPFLAVVFVGFSEFFQFLSDKYKGIAEYLRRQLDFFHSFGWEVSRKEVTDILLKISKNVEEKSASTPQENYFMSNKGVGPVKSLENLEESSWWSKHLAKTAFNYFLFIIVIVALSSIVMLYVAFNCNIANQYVPKISKIVTSTIMVLFSIGFIKTAIGYFKFHLKSEQIDTLLSDKIRYSPPLEQDCVKLWSEYHIARASAPLIPTIIWELNKDRLNKLRETHR